jgi:hypothetical protein
MAFLRPTILAERPIRSASNSGAVLRYDTPVLIRLQSNR